MKNLWLSIACAGALIGCRPANLPRPTDEEAAKIVDAAESTFTSGDPVRIMEHYAPDAVLFDADQGEPTDDRAVATKWAENFVALKPTKFSPGSASFSFSETIRLSVPASRLLNSPAKKGRSRQKSAILMSIANSRTVYG